MSERNRDKIKKLEHELGRYQKKVGELMKANAKLHEDIKGLDQLRMAFDAWTIQIALAYAAKAKLVRLNAKYKAFSEAAGLPLQWERTRVLY